MDDKEFTNGDEVFVGSRLVGIWIGNNPVTGSEVVYAESGNEYKSYHTWQVERYPCVSVPVDFKSLSQ